MDLNLHSSSSSSSSSADDHDDDDEDYSYEAMIHRVYDAEWDPTDEESTSASEPEQGADMMSYDSDLIPVRKITLESGIVPVRGSANKRFNTFDARFATFYDWPPGLKQRPRELAEAGLYYQGASDEVHCYKCSGILKGWQDDEQPWTEHARYFPLCTHLRLVKGDNFVKEVQKLEKFTRQRPAAAFASETQDIPEDIVCKLCMAQEITTVLLPCGHFFTCSNCALLLRECSICRKTIKAYVRSYRV